MNLQVGDKIEIPLTKSIGCTWEKSVAIQTALAANQNYLYLCAINKDDVEISALEGHLMGECLDHSEVKPYSENSPDIQTIRELRKSIQEIKNG